MASGDRTAFDVTATPVAGLDFETTLWAIGPIATFVHRCSNDFRDQAFHGQTHAWMFAGQRGEWAAEPANHVSAVSLDMRHGTQLIVQRLACDRDASCHVARRSFSARQFV